VVSAKPTSNIMMNTTNSDNVTAPGDSETLELAVGGGSPQRSSSASLNLVERVPSMALSTGKATFETVVSTCTQREPGPIGGEEQQKGGCSRSIWLLASILPSYESWCISAGHIVFLLMFVEQAIYDTFHPSWRFNA